MKFDVLKQDIKLLKIDMHLFDYNVAKSNIRNLN